eukprot:1161833-Pelagomonas_calceolata.AAC.10
MCRLFLNWYRESFLCLRSCSFLFLPAKALQRQAMLETLQVPCTLATRVRSQKGMDESRASSSSSSSNSSSSCSSILVPVM